MHNVFWTIWIPWIDEGVLEMQRQWIGRSEGAEVDFEIVGSDKSLPSTQPDQIHFWCHLLCVGS